MSILIERKPDETIREAALRSAWMLVLEHLGPGAHPSGSPQSVHAGHRGGRKPEEPTKKEEPKPEPEGELIPGSASTAQKWLQSNGIETTRQKVLTFMKLAELRLRAEKMKLDGQAGTQEFWDLDEQITQEYAKLGIKGYEESSSYQHALANYQADILGRKVADDFTPGIASRVGEEHISDAELIADSLLPSKGVARTVYSDSLKKGIIYKQFGGKITPEGLAAYSDDDLEVLDSIIDDPISSPVIAKEIRDRKGDILGAVKAENPNDTAKEFVNDARSVLQSEAGNAGYLDVIRHRAVGADVGHDYISASNADKARLKRLIAKDTGQVLARSDVSGKALVNTADELATSRFREAMLKYREDLAGDINITQAYVGFDADDAGIPRYGDKHIADVGMVVYDMPAEMRRGSKEFAEYSELVKQEKQLQDIITAQGKQRGLSDTAINILKKKPWSFRRATNENLGKLVPVVARSEQAAGDVKGPAAEAFVAHINDSWAGSSTDNEVSVAFQKAVAKRFGMKPDIAAVPDATDWKADRLLEQYGDVFDAAADSVYKKTQSYLESQGIDELVVYRGMSMGSTASSRADTEYREAVRVLDRRTSLEPNSMSGERWVTDKKITGNPMSSYSINYDTAKEFSSGYEYRMLIASKIKRKNIFSTALTGPGCLTEGEVCVLRHDQDAKVLTAKGGSLPDGGRFWAEVEHSTEH